jgi:hypothetical protein
MVTDIIRTAVTIMVRATMAIGTMADITTAGTDITVTDNR